MKFFYKITILILLYGISGCSKGDDEMTIVPKSDAKALLAISFNTADNPDFTSNIEGSVQQGSKIAFAMVPNGTDTSALTPTLQLSDKASYSPQGAQDFSTSVTYTITAENGSEITYEVNVVVSQSSENQIVRFVFRAVDNDIPDTVEGSLGTDAVGLVTTFNTDVTALLPQLEVSEGATYTPQGVQDFSEPVVYTVIAEDGAKAQYTVNIKTERDLLIAISEANPDNTLSWNFAEADLESWNGVNLNDQGYVNSLFLKGVNLLILPDEIGFFIKLEVLELEDNQLPELPKTIGLLGNLIGLGLNHNQLNQLPSELHQLTSLNNLQLSYNRFEEIPSVVFELKNLTMFFFSGNQLKELPSEIALLSNLEGLNVGENFLSNFPDELQLLTKLTGIGFSDNLFEKFPEVLFNLNALTGIDANGNKIQQVPADIWRLNNLFVLKINNNKLTDLPPELALIQGLEIIDITNNAIEVLPAEICAMKFLYIAKDETTICRE